MAEKSVDDRTVAAFVPLRRVETVSVAGSGPPAGTAAIAAAKTEPGEARDVRADNPFGPAAEPTPPAEADEEIVLVQAEEPAAANASSGDYATPPPAPQPSPAEPGMSADDAQTSEFGTLRDDPAAPFSAVSLAPPLTLAEVGDSVLSPRFPPLVEAVQKRTIAYGVQLEASGAFDTKFNYDSNNIPQGFYENYRQILSLKQPVYEGGEVFGGYRIGRGFFQDWHQERQTDDGGEFKLGFIKPLWRDVDIDERRAALWRAGFERQAVEFEIAIDRITFLLDASVVYWDWVTAGRNLLIAEDLYNIAVDRNEKLTALVDEGAAAEITRVDNRRLIVSREQKLIAARQKFTESAVKLSIFYRDVGGRPVIAGEDRLPEMPTLNFPGAPPADLAVSGALAGRPESALFDAVRRAVEVDLNQARNLFLPNLDTSLVASQDIGSPTSSKADKSPFKLEAYVFFETPIQRRKALGKVRATEGKLAQVNAKRQFARDKIAAETRAAVVALDAAAEQLVRAEENRDLAARLAENERANFLDGASDLIDVNIRELQAAEAALSVNEAIRDYRIAEAALRAAVGQQDVGTPLGIVPPPIQF